MDAAAQLDRDELLDDHDLVGLEFCRAYAQRVDEWLQALFAAHLGDPAGITLVAIGGYGRSTLSPQSDLDVMLLHDDWNDSELEEAAQGLWLPVWDAHIALGHSVRTVHQSLELADTDLETATSLLSLRHIAGDADLAEHMGAEARRAWRENRRMWMPQLIDDSRERKRTNGEIAFLLEPDLKVGAGGIRDLNALRWLYTADVDVLDQERHDLLAAYDVLLAARVELHRSTRRKGDRLILDEQDAVAAALGLTDADAMMSEIAASARTVTWIAEDLFHRAMQSLRAEPPTQPVEVADGVLFNEGTIALSETAAVARDPVLLLRLAIAAAQRQARVDRDSLDRLVNDGPPISTPWSPELRDLFVELLLAGDAAIPVIETLEHIGLFTRLLPEWEPTRSKVQRNQYHRFTVDRHLLEAAAVASDLVGQVDRPDLLVVGALLHDIGKGYPGDHTEVGVELIDTIAANMGFAPTDVTILQRLCEHHLLLPEVATRRDIEDSATIGLVADAVETPQFLALLTALTEADSIATGPAAWSRWKSHLIYELSRGTEAWLLADGQRQIEASFPDEDHLRMLTEHDHYIHGQGDTLTVISIDRPGMFARVAGALALNFLNILGAQTHVEHGKALEVVRVVHSDGEDVDIDWTRVVGEVGDALATNEDLGPHFVMRARSRLGRKVRSPVPLVPVRVEFDNEASGVSTVIDVGGPDRLGLLYELSTALVEFGLDQQQTRVQTLAGDVADAFYVQTFAGAKITDPDEQEAIRSTLLAILGREVD